MGEGQVADRTLMRLREAAAALGEPRRFELALLLLRAPHTVQEITELTGWRQPLVSHHLAVLSRAGLIDVTRLGRYRQYRLASTEDGPAAGLLRLFRRIAASGSYPSEIAGLEPPLPEREQAVDIPATATPAAAPTPAPTQPKAPAPGPDPTPVRRPARPEIEDFLL